MLLGWQGVLSIDTNGTIPALKTLPDKAFPLDPSLCGQKGLGARFGVHAGEVESAISEKVIPQNNDHYENTDVVIMGRYKILQPDLGSLQEFM